MTSYYRGHEGYGEGEHTDGGYMANGVHPIAEGPVQSVSLYDFIEEVLRSPEPRPTKATKRPARR